MARGGHTGVLRRGRAERRHGDGARPVVRRAVVEELAEELVGREGDPVRAKGREARGAHKSNDGLLCRAGKADDAVRRGCQQLRDEPGDEKGDGDELDGEGVEIPCRGLISPADLWNRLTYQRNARAFRCTEKYASRSELL